MTCEHLVRVGLVCHVPHDFILRRVEHVVQRDLLAGFGFRI